MKGINSCEQEVKCYLPWSDEVQSTKGADNELDPSAGGNSATDLHV